MKILVTGAKGMIGSHLVQGLLVQGYSVVGVDRVDSNFVSTSYTHYVCNLGDREKFQNIVKIEQVDRIIHLAAIAHATGVDWNKYYYANVECANTVFEVGKDIPVLFISTVDVFGFTDGVVNTKTPLKPVSVYAKTKAMAEENCQKICKQYSIFRFSPVYTDDVKRDIQKRYYLKYPNIAYKVGSGSEFEILNIQKAVRSMIDWCQQKVENDIKIIKDDELMRVVDYIAEEKKAGRANTVIYFPRWTLELGYNILKLLTGENRYTYLLNKAVHPLRTEE